MIFWIDFVNQAGWLQSTPYYQFPVWQRKAFSRHLYLFTVAKVCFTRLPSDNFELIFDSYF